ncbi:MAG: GCN5-related N-acetyltransferase [Candidatus Azambacteria bacterium GW2011_GWA2_42_9]|uniref:GCN5-related N-acetyltransferase n=1 Tax=Candidatus Azambacteria bacterium GW2011_GWA2_42_9 TaxID=1618613 RepID=A0A0G1DX65_9BACT|nr:MAG: GCN5-related N-acetyltransferase [Candidatus Azambacteria bacterium GW2011_GWA2_42_9]
MKIKNRVVFLRGRKVILRPLDKETDLEACQRWINDPEVRQYLKRFLPTSKQTESEWLDSLGKKTDDIVLAIETLDGKFIGTMGLHKIDWKDRTAITGALIGDKTYWGKGYGTDAKMVLLDYAFNQLGLRKICSSVLAFNKRSLRYNLHCGYKVEGIQKKQIFRDGKYRDKLLLAVFQEDWLPIWEKYRRTGKIK